MSYDYFLQAHENGEAQEINTADILKVFEKYIVNKGADWIDLDFGPENHCTVYMDTEAPTISSLNINRPCGGQLGICIYKVMQLGHFVFFEPDGKCPIILGAQTEKHLPEDMIEALGTPATATSEEAFLELYYSNR